MEAFYNRNPHQWQGVDATLEKALSYVVHSKRNNLSHRNPVATIDTDGLTMTPELIDVSCKCEDLTGADASTFEDSAKLIDHAFKSFSKAILDIQCGGGKSVVASAIIARSKDKWLIVRDTTQACRQQREMLLAYGVPRDDITVLSGWNAEACKANLDALESFKWGASKRRQMRPAIEKARESIGDGFTPFYSKASSPCIECRARCDFKGSRTHRQVIGALKFKRVVVMTHSRFLEVVHYAELKDRRILIDEEPALFEGVTFASTEVAFLLETFKGCLNGKVEAHLQGILADTKTGSIEDFCFYNHAEVKTLQGRASKLDADSKEVAYRYIRFMSYEADRFAFVEKDLKGKKVSLVRNRLNWTLPNDVYVLNASSRFGLAEWEGFTVVRSQEQREADGVTVYAFQANHTKHRMDKEARDFLKYALDLVKTNGRSKVLLATNKEDTRSKEVDAAVTWFKAECAKVGVEVSEAERGSIIGRNDWRDSDCVILGYGLFTSVSNLVLKQSLVEGVEIDGARIWDTKTIESVEVRQPRIKKGFVDAGLRETDRRLFADEVYQVGLRGRARNWKGDTMDVITIAPSLDYVIPLTQVLPEARIVFDSLEVTGIKTEDLLKGDKELTGVFGIGDKPENREAVRAIACQLLADRLDAWKDWTLPGYGKVE